MFNKVEEVKATTNPVRENLINFFRQKTLAGQKIEKPRIKSRIKQTLQESIKEGTRKSAHATRIMQQWERSSPPKK